MENSYLIRMSLFPNLNSDKHSDSVISSRLNNLVQKAGVFPLEKVRQHKKFFIVNEIRRTAKKKILHCFKRRHCENLCCERTSQFYICVCIQCRRRRLPTNGILSLLIFPAETDVLVPVSSQSTEVVVVNFVVVLKFPIL